MRNHQEEQGILNSRENNILHFLPCFYLYPGRGAFMLPVYTFFCFSRNVWEWPKQDSMSERFLCPRHKGWSQKGSGRSRQDSQSHSFSALAFSEPARMRQKEKLSTVPTSLHYLIPLHLSPLNWHRSKLQPCPCRNPRGVFPYGAPQCARARIPHPQVLDCLWHSRATWLGLYLVLSCQKGTGKVLAVAVQMCLEGMWMMLLLSSCCKARLAVRALPVPITAAAAAPDARLVFGRKGGHIFKRMLKAKLKTYISFNLL